MSQQNATQFQGFPFIGFWTDRGRNPDRPQNEDNFYIPPANLDPQLVQRKGYLCIVADGMGGYAKGEVASELAVRRVAEDYYGDANTEIQSSLHRAIQNANEAVINAAEQSQSAGMGTTIVAVVWRGNEVVVASVGDSRAYLISQGQATQITRDHSRVQEMVEAGLLSLDQAEKHPQKNVITRALGKAQVEVDFKNPAAEPGEAILLCSDGLSNLVQSEEMAQTVSHFPPNVAAQKLVALANERGGPDNITAVIMQVAPPVGTDTVVLPRRRAQTSHALPIVAGIVVGMLLLLGTFVSIFSLQRETPTLPQQLALATSSPAIAVVVPTTVPSLSPTIAMTPTTVQTATPLPTATTSATIRSIILASPTVQSATAVPTPPIGELRVPIPSGQGIIRMVQLIWFIDTTSDSPQSQSFYDVHREIWCKAGIKDPAKCINGTVIMTSDQVKSELKPVTLKELPNNLNKKIWLSVFSDDRTIGLLQVEALKVRKNKWIMMAGTFKGTVSQIGDWNGQFEVQPNDFIFEWNGQTYVQSVLSSNSTFQVPDLSEGSPP